MTSAWKTDLRVLSKTVEMYEKNGQAVRASLIIADLDDLDEHTVSQSLRRLSAHGYVATRGALGAPVLDVTAVHERGLRAARFWPDDAEHLAERIMAALTEAAEQEPEAEKRGRLRRAASSVGEVGRDVFAEVLASVITKSAGMG